MIFQVKVVKGNDEMYSCIWHFLSRIGEHISVIGRMYKVVDIVYEMKPGTYKGQPVIVRVIDS